MKGLINCNEGYTVVRLIIYLLLPWRKDGIWDTFTDLKVKDFVKSQPMNES